MEEQGARRVAGEDGSFGEALREERIGPRCAKQRETDVKKTDLLSEDKPPA